MSGDSNWSSVALLLHADGTDGSTTVTDSSSAARTVTVGGNAQLDTAQAKWGASSLLFDGTGDFCTVPYDSSLHLSNQDFTIEFWIRGNASNSSRDIICFGNSSNQTAWRLRVTSGGYLDFIVTNDAGTSTFCTQTSGQGFSASHSQFHHVAITRSGTSFRVFVGGALVGSTTSSVIARASASGPSYRLVIGADTGLAAGLIGWLDDIRITAGVARYTEAFTPPAAAFPDGPPPSELFALGSSALGAGRGLVWRQELRTLGGSAVGAGKPVLSISNAFVQGASALGGGKAIAWSQLANVKGASALGYGKSVVWAQYVNSKGHSALGAGKALISIPQTVAVKGGSGLGSAKTRIYNDFTGAVDPSGALIYVADLITDAGVVRAPISSWQATIQLEESCYGQCVVPAVFDLIDAVSSATEFIIYRRARLLDGSYVEQMMVSVPVDTRSISQGTSNYTAVLSGYFDEFPGEDELPESMGRTLANVRSLTEGDGGLRIRSDIDWLLRPGMKAKYGATELIVDWINYYVPGNDQYMDIGERA